MGDRIMLPFAIQAMREPETFKHLIISGLGIKPKNVLHHLVSAPSLLPTWRALGLQDFFQNDFQTEFPFQPMASVMETAIADPRLDLYGPVSAWRALYGGPQESPSIYGLSPEELLEMKSYLLHTAPNALPKKLKEGHDYLAARLVSTASTMQNALRFAFEVTSSVKQRLKDNDFTAIPIATIANRPRLQPKRRSISMAQQAMLFS